MRFFLIMLGLTILNIGVMSQNSDISNKSDAERIWELAIEAKGGRNRIEKVQNLLVLSSYGEKYGLVELFVLPNKWWRFSNQAEPFGKQVTMNNLEQDLYYISNDSNPTTFIKTEMRGKETLLETQIYFLLETKWIKPIPINFTTEKVRGKLTDVVKTIINDKPVNFFFDKETHLVVKIAYLNDKGKPYSFVTFSDYVLVDGIQIPTKVGYESNSKILINIKFNVDYDKTLFETPPTVAAGPDAWKPKIKF